MTKILKMKINFCFALSLLLLVNINCLPNTYNEMNKRKYTKCAIQQKNLIAIIIIITRR